MKSLALSLTVIAMSVAGLEASFGEEKQMAKTGEDLSVARLRCEYLENPLGIDVRTPRLSWIVQSDLRGQRQTAYQILVASTRESLDKDAGDLWDSGKVESGETIQVTYHGKPLTSRMSCWWKVRAWDRDGRPSAWSEPASWTMGLLDTADWTAKWISQSTDAFGKDVEPPSSLLRKTFSLDGKPVRAVAYVAAMGYYELHINGKTIGDAVFRPPVSDYAKRAYYITDDITNSLVAGKNAVGVWLGRGWYAAGFPGVIHRSPIARIQIEITLDNGKTVCIASDETWKARPGPVTALGTARYSKLVGERLDATQELPGWAESSFDDATWAPAVVLDPPTSVLCAAMIQPDRFQEAIAPVALNEIAPGEWMYDFGRNFTGVVEMRVSGTAGTPIVFSYIERKDEQKDKWIDYGQRDELVPRDGAATTFRSPFSYHAFRYLKVTGLAKPPKIDDAKGLFLYTDIAQRGAFECSNDLFNWIYKTTLYTYRCVCAGGATVDCPHRERLAYGGDGQITSRTALYAYDAGALYTKWLGNYRDAQNPDTGELPNTAPYPYPAGGGPTWGAFAVFLPWDLYLHYGDTRVLSDCYPMMQKYVQFLDSKSKDGLLAPYGDEHYGFLGDWVAPDHDQGGDRPWSPEEWRTFFNNCFYAYIAAYVGKTASLIGKQDDAAKYAQQAEQIRRDTHKRWFKPDTNSYVDGGQPYLAFALLSGVTPKELRPAVLANLEKTIAEKNNYHIDAGMHGSMFLLRCLNEFRRDEFAARMMNQTTYPGWGYMREQGATTLWERWDGDRSQIHSTLLAAGEWFPRAIGGIKPDENGPGFKHVIIDPRPVGDLTWAKTRYDTIRGPVTSDWRIEDGRFRLHVEIPANTTALVRLPARDGAPILENGKPIDASQGVRLVKHDGGLAELEIASGKYDFEAQR